MNSPVLSKVICEIGHNHNGDLSYAKEYVDKLIECRPDAITIQYREASRYEGEDIKLKLNNIAVGIAIGDDKKIPYFESLGTDFYKVLSKDIENYRLLEKLKETNKKVYVSTGLSDFDQIG